VSNWIDSGNSRWIRKTQRGKRRKSNRFIWYRRVVKRGCGILNGVLLVSRKETTKYPHTEIEKGMLGEEARKSRGEVT
jgi:hypothetical protein